MIEKEIITEIAVQLEKPVSYVYKIMVEAQPVIAFIGLASLTLFLVLLYLGVRPLRKKLRTGNYTGDDKFWTAMVGTIAIITLAILISIQFSLSMGRILLPEYSAIMEIAEMVSGATC